jgi:hypothetical protein
VLVAKHDPTGDYALLARGLANSRTNLAKLKDVDVCYDTFKDGLSHDYVSIQSSPLSHYVLKNETAQPV